MLYITEDGQLEGLDSPPIRPLECSESIIGDVMVFRAKDFEWIMLKVREDQHDFLVEQVGEKEWMITARVTSLGDDIYDTDYVFGEELEVVAKGDELGYAFKELARMKNYRPEETLFLKRVNK